MEISIIVQSTNYTQIEELGFLFYGTGVIFEITKIYHKEVQKSTLNQLDVLQQIITNKSVDFNDDKIKKYTKTLCKRLKEIHDLNIEAILKHQLHFYENNFH